MGWNQAYARTVDPQLQKSNRNLQPANPTSLRTPPFVMLRPGDQSGFTTRLQRSGRELNIVPLLPRPLIWRTLTTHGLKTELAQLPEMGFQLLVALTSAWHLVTMVALGELTSACDVDARQQAQATSAWNGVNKLAPDNCPFENCVLLPVRGHSPYPGPCLQVLTGTGFLQLFGTLPYGTVVRRRLAEPSLPVATLLELESVHDINDTLWAKKNRMAQSEEWGS